MQWKERGRAAALHLSVSIAIAALLASLMFLVWYPYPYRQVSGGDGLFTLLVSVDVLVGPLLTFAVFSRTKSRQVLRQDLLVIGVLQTMALGYGLYTVAQARPVYLVHEVDRFQIVTPADIDPTELAQAKPEFWDVPSHGIRVIGLRPARNNAETQYAIESALAGRDISLMPARWQELDDANKAQILQRGHDGAYLRARSKDGGEALDRVIAAAGLAPEQVTSLPLVGRRNDWSVLLDRRDFRIIGYVPIDGF